MIPAIELVRDPVAREHVRHLSALEIRLASTYLKCPPAVIRGPLRGLIVGEAPGPNTSSDLPMFPYPKNSAGGRLLKMSGLQAGEYLGRIHRTNLLRENPGDKWPTELAETRASEIHDWIVDDFRIRCWDLTCVAIPEFVTSLRVLLLGKRVGAAFGIDEPFVEREIGGVDYRTIPHPSGRSPVYNVEEARVAAQAAVLWVAGIV